MDPATLEANYLDEIWFAKRYGGRGERLNVLRYMAGVVIQREASWDYVATRQSKPPRSLDDDCFVCGDRGQTLYRHHVIQVQHGGSNSPRNVVKLCHACHHLIHPWLEKPSSLHNRRGWTSVADWARWVIAALAGKSSRKELP